MKHATDDMDDSMIPIARPQVGDPEIENVVHVLRSGICWQAGGSAGRCWMAGSMQMVPYLMCLKGCSNISPKK
ncbi:MAG: hypothetical protein GQ567_08295 [Methanosarcinales archaeon]|nr:hypothetical protein [Methanosarcinales archaeon]